MTLELGLWRSSSETSPPPPVRTKTTKRARLAAQSRRHAGRVKDDVSNDSERLPSYRIVGQPTAPPREGRIPRERPHPFAGVAHRDAASTAPRLLPRLDGTNPPKMRLYDFCNRCVKRRYPVLLLDCRDDALPGASRRPKGSRPTATSDGRRDVAGGVGSVLRCATPFLWPFVTERARARASAAVRSV